ncbi:hypothetical protein FD754_008364 [Muntiacus muntjak]|uniref:Oxysterol-binding protein-related protein 10 n=1 Tax=Muntiacus muntjak TaxID=9888 RepID=A0A5N3WTR0_MUNMU|nr:hypothetical protein FD754_008364 [Muntiacus muntjak]
MLRLRTAEARCLWVDEPGWISSQACGIPGRMCAKHPQTAPSRRPPLPPPSPSHPSGSSQCTCPEHPVSCIKPGLAICFTYDNIQMMTQVEGQQKNLVHAIESLPGSGPLTALDQDLLLLKATSAATLSCLGECLSLLQQSLQHAGQSSHRPGASESILGWHGPKSHSTEQLKNGTLGSLPSASASITWAILPNSTEDEQTFPPEPEPEDRASPRAVAGALPGAALQPRSRDEQLC